MHVPVKKFTTLALAAMVAASSLVLGAPSAWADVSPNTRAYCTNMRAGTTCSITVSAGYGTVEGQSVSGRVVMRPNYTVSLRAFELQWDSAGKPSGVKPIGPAFQVTTDAWGSATFNAPTTALTAPSTGGTGKFIVQASDFSTAHWVAGNSILGIGSTAPLFDLRSARALHQRTTSNTRISGGTFYATQLAYGIPGQVYQAQLQVGGQWVNATESGVASNGVVSSNGGVYLQWSRPSSVGTGVYPLRYINVTRNQVIHTSSFAVYNAPTGVWGDQDGDRRADILAVDTAGVLRTYVTRSGPSLSEGFNVGSGWGAMTWVATLPDMDNNGYSEMLARRNDGTLWLYRGTKFGSFDSARQVGKGWTGLDQLTILPDIDGDKQPEMLGRTTDGKLLRYKVTLNGASYVNQVGTGWGSIARIVSLGDMTRDGVPDFVAIGTNGNLYRYALDRTGRVVSSAQVGRGWAAMSQAFSPGDMDGDGIRDLVARRSDGKLFFYKNQGNGSFGYAKQIGTGWNGIRLFT